MKKQHANEELLAEIERTFLSNENGSTIGRITSHFRFVSASHMP